MILAGVLVSLPPPVCHPDLPREAEENTFVVPRAFVEQWIEDEWDLFPPGCSAVPVFENGKPIGIKQFSIKQDSALFRLGVKNGDVIMRIEQSSLSTVDKVLQVFEKIKRLWESGDEFEVSLTIRRKGVVRILRYLIR